jgi:predicted 2-oxoglutarate/Fe(II)-dependent dioxygenase YbiX
MRAPDPYVRPAFWDAATCAGVRSAMDRGARSAAEIFRGRFVVDRRVRRAFDIEPDAATIAHADASIDRARDDVARYFGLPLSGSEGSGFLRYEEGDFYGPHVDQLADASPAFVRRVAVVVFLSEVEGGALRLMPAHDDDCVHEIAPAIGLLVAFPAVRPHEVRSVLRGTRDVVVNWFY